MAITTELVKFRLIQTPCCGHLLCWVNPRFPTFCTECGTMMKDVRGCVLKLDEEAELRLHV